MCCKSKDRNCKNPFISEADLIKQFEKLFHKIDINEILIKERIKKEIEKIKNFNQFISNIEQDIQIKDIDIRDYCRFVLKRGDIQDKRELLECVKGNLIIKDKEIFINN